MPQRNSPCIPPASCPYQSIVCICMPRDAGNTWNCIPIP
jgi:hypothetical protein